MFAVECVCVLGAAAVDYGAAQIPSKVQEKRMYEKLNNLHQEIVDQKATDQSWNNYVDYMNAKAIQAYPSVSHK